MARGRKSEISIEFKKKIHKYYAHDCKGETLIRKVADEEGIELNEKWFTNPQAYIYQWLKSLGLDPSRVNATAKQKALALAAPPLKKKVQTVDASDVPLSEKLTKKIDSLAQPETKKKSNEPKVKPLLKKLDGTIFNKPDEPKQKIESGEKKPRGRKKKEIPESLTSQSLDGQKISKNQWAVIHACSTKSVPLETWAPISLDDIQIGDKIQYRAVDATGTPISYWRFRTVQNITEKKIRHGDNVRIEKTFHTEGFFERERAEMAILPFIRRAFRLQNRRDLNDEEKNLIRMMRKNKELHLSEKELKDIDCEEVQEKTNQQAEGEDENVVD